MTVFGDETACSTLFLYCARPFLANNKLLIYNYEKFVHVKQLICKWCF